MDTFKKTVRRLGIAMGTGSRGLFEGIERAAEGLGSKGSRQPSRSEEIRSVVLEEIQRSLREKRASGNGTHAIEERLEAITASLIAIEERLARLSGNGAVSSEQIEAAVLDVEKSQGLDEEEQVLFEHIFRENVALQKTKTRGKKQALSR